MRYLTLKLSQMTIELCIDFLRASASSIAQRLEEFLIRCRTHLLKLINLTIYVTANKGYHRQRSYSKRVLFQATHKQSYDQQVSIAIQQQMYIRTALLAICILSLGCLTQDALISPKEPFTFSINKTNPVTEQFLIEVSPDNYAQEWASVFSQYSSKNPDTIAQLQFSVVFKEDPTQTFQTLNKCRFEGYNAQWCKVGQRSPPINLYHHLIKIKLDCPRACQFTVQIANTESKWNGKDRPIRFGAPATAAGTISSTKMDAAIKIGGWMLLTLILILGAIQFAVRVADWVDEKSNKAQKHRKRE